MQIFYQKLLLLAIYIFMDVPYPALGNPLFYEGHHHSQDLRGNLKT
jgi:hypothetical protein